MWVFQQSQEAHNGDVSVNTKLKREHKTTQTNFWFGKKGGRFLNEPQISRNAGPLAST